MAKQPFISGSGLEGGTVGKPVLFTLDGRRSGIGNFSCRCRAPSGNMTYVLINDNEDGTYTVDLNACEPGLHTVDIEWNNQPVKDSPFLVRIQQAPDPKKLRVYGPGIISTVLGDFEGIIHVDTKGAGPGTLNVSIHGPKEGFKIDMYRDYQDDRTINVQYNPTIPGIYTINILWSNRHADRSPYEVFLASNKEHLIKWEQNRDDTLEEKRSSLENGN